jgi:hypothetical protein
MSQSTCDLARRATKIKRPVWAPPPPAAAPAARRDDRGGLDRRAADDGGRVRHIKNHADLLSGKVHAVLTRVTATAADAAAIIHDICLRSGDGFPDVLVVEHQRQGRARQRRRQ